MDYQEFVSAFAQRMKAGYKARGMDYEISLRQVGRNNQGMGTMLVIEKPGKSPAIFMEKYYDLFRDGADMDEMAGQLIESIESDKLGVKLDGSDFTKDRILGNLRMELINADRNQELLARVPHRVIADLAVVYQYVAMEEGDGICTAMITNKNASIMEVTEEDLFRSAMDHRNDNAPYRIMGMRQIIEELDGQMHMESPPGETVEEDEMEMTILGTKDGIYGASCILYPEAVDELSRRKGGNFILLPCSIHEWIVLPESCSEEHESLGQLVRHINQREVDPVEVLSDHVYHYDVQKQELSVYEGGQTQEQGQIRM